MSKVTYNCFELGCAGSSGPFRSVAQKVFTDAVPEANVDSAPGRTGTTFLDSLGRSLRTEVQLGADYQNKIVQIGARIYDALGRVSL